jgi:hypothetical protein
MTRKTILLSGAAVFLLLLLNLTGCALKNPPRTQFDAEGNPILFKRMAKHMAVDYFYRWRHKAYNKPAGNFRYLLINEEKQVFEDFGTPDYVRRPFSSEDGEKVNEWAYLGKNMLFQFINGDMVYSGPITDYEQILARHGYPDALIQAQSAEGVKTQVLIYGRWGSDNNEYSLANGYLSEMIKGNTPVLK